MADLKYRKDGQKKIILSGQVVYGWEVLEETTFDLKYPSNLCRCLGCRAKQLVRTAALSSGQSRQCRRCADHGTPVEVPGTAKVFPSIKAAAQALAVHRNRVSRAIRGEYFPGLVVTRSQSSRGGG